MILRESNRVPYEEEYVLVYKNCEHWKTRGRRLSLGEYKRAVSWSKYLVSSGAAIKGEGEEEWSADMSQLLIGSKFASGRHSRIYRGVYKQIDVAIKLVSQPEEDPDLASFLEKQFTSEVALLLRLRHQNIITFVGACKKPPVFCIITEYLAGGSLRKYLHHQEPHSVPLEIVLKLALDIARGMQYLHSQGIIHRDLKSENLLLGEDMCVKVADFGISCLESQTDSARAFTGTYRWMAPEMIKEKHHTKKVDVYSFGIVLWELLTGLIPFDNMTPEQAAYAVSYKGLCLIYEDKKDRGLLLLKAVSVVAGVLDNFSNTDPPKNSLVVYNARPPLPSKCPLVLSNLINRCWSRNPRKRPHFDEIVPMLEHFNESLVCDPDFFILHTQRPTTILGCFPKCNGQFKSAICKA